MTSAVKGFYDAFSGKLLADFIYGNRRVDLIREFCARAIPSETRSILEIGCGTGANAAYLSRRVAPNAQIVAVDISKENIRIAKALFRNSNVAFEERDILEHACDKRFEVIILPDVLEHVPRQDHEKLFEFLNSHLSHAGRILITIPSPQYQQHLHHTRTGLQIVDEIITLDDLLQLAKAVEGSLTYFCMVHVHETNKYIHAMIERGIGVPIPVQTRDLLDIKMALSLNLADKLAQITPFRKIRTARRKLKAWLAGIK